MKKIILAVAVAAVATMAIVSSASAGVTRYQTQSMTITAVQPEGAVGQFNNVWTHTYNVTLNPCDNSFSGTGALKGTINGPYAGTETITGHLDGDAVSFTAKRSPDGVEYSLANAPLDNTTVTLATSTPVVPWDLEFKVSATTRRQLVELQESRRLRQPDGRRRRRGPLLHRDADHPLSHGCRTDGLRLACRYRARRPRPPVPIRWRARLRPGSPASGLTQVL